MALVGATRCFCFISGGFVAYSLGALARRPSLQAGGRASGRLSALLRVRHCPLLDTEVYGDGSTGRNKCTRDLPY